MARMKKYYDGVSVPPQLPDSYMVGRGSKQCHACHYYQNTVCNKWKAIVRKNWVCKSYKARKRIITPSNTTRSSTTSNTNSNTNSSTGGNTGGY